MLKYQAAGLISLNVLRRIDSPIQERSLIKNIQMTLAVTVINPHKIFARLKNRKFPKSVAAVFKASGYHYRGALRYLPILLVINSFMMEVPII